MTEPTDHAGLLARLRYQPGAPDHMWAIDVAELMGMAANVIEADSAELRQERERADYLDSVINREPDWLGTIADLNSDLARAREVIKKIRDYLADDAGCYAPDVKEIISEFDKQNGADDDE